MASQVSTHSGARVLAQGCWVPTPDPSSMEKMTEMLVVKVTQLQDHIWALRVHPALQCLGLWVSQDPVPVLRGVAAPLGRDFPAGSSQPLRIRASPWGGTAAGLPQGQTVPRWLLQFPHTFQLQLTSL